MLVGPLYCRLPKVAVLNKIWRFIGSLTTLEKIQERQDSNDWDKSWTEILRQYVKEDVGDRAVEDMEDRSIQKGEKRKGEEIKSNKMSTLQWI